MSTPTTLCIFGCLFFSQLTAAQPLQPALLPWWLRPSAQLRDAFSFTGNQALLANQRDIEAGSLLVNRYSIKNLYQSAGALAIPAGSGGAAISVVHLGYTGYSTTRAGIAYGKKLSRWAAIGLQFDYFMTSISGYGKAAAPGFEIGLVLHPSDKLLAGFQVANPFATRQAQRPAACYSTQMSFRASPVFSVAAALVKLENNPTDISVQMFYMPGRILFVNAGYSGLHDAFSLGLGLQWRQYALRVYTAMEQPAGFSSGLQLLFHPPVKEKEAE